MAKLRKMLGKPDSPCAVALMRLIETQSQQTLIRWAVEYTARRCLPIFAKQLAEDTRPSDALNSCRAYLSGELRLAEVKPFLKAARQAAQDADQFPARRQLPEQLQPPVLLSKTRREHWDLLFTALRRSLMTKQVSINRQLFMTSWLKKNLKRSCVPCSRQRFPTNRILLKLTGTADLFDHQLFVDERMKM